MFDLCVWKSKKWGAENGLRKMQKFRACYGRWEIAFSQVLLICELMERISFSEYLLSKCDMYGKYYLHCW
jgi:hypothetical protein